MSRHGAMYLQATQAAADHRLAAGLALAGGHTEAAHRYADTAEHYDAKAAAAKRLGRAQYAGRKAAAKVPASYFADAPTLDSQLAAARTLRLGGSAGQLPRGLSS